MNDDKNSKDNANNKADSVKDTKTKQLETDQEQKLKDRIAEIRKRDPFIYR